MNLANTQKLLHSSGCRSWFWRPGRERVMLSAHYTAILGWKENCIKYLVGAQKKIVMNLNFSFSFSPFYFGRWRLNRILIFYKIKWRDGHERAKTFTCSTINCRGFPQTCFNELSTKLWMQKVDGKLSPVDDMVKSFLFRCWKAKFERVEWGED